jgi:hypothetical protein
MDCFIIRVYRHITQDNDQPDEIAGLVERVGRQDNGRPFSSYRSLVSVLRDEYASEAATDTEPPGEEIGRMRLVPAAKRQ